MAATPIPTSQRFFQPGVVGILYLPTIAATTLIPTTAEVTAGTDLTREVDDWSGWTVSTAFIETKDASTVLRPQLAGAVTFEGSSLTFNGSKNGTDARTDLHPRRSRATSSSVTPVSRPARRPTCTR
jgi:hypothetical protein